MQLKRDLIIESALELLQAYGLADVTMRRVATTLSVAPGALYWHIKNKQDLIAAMASRIIEPLNGSTTEDLALNLRSVLLSHRDGAEVTIAGLSLPGSKAWEQLVERFIASIDDDSEAARVAALSIIHLVLGATLMEQSRAQLQETIGTPQPDYDGESDIRSATAIILSGLSQS
ncbi:TetR family transcriptional regulator [Corynebacterium flavescens]|uniref:TetR family transcriptional regulator n=1 Tax=Corynebacterium flavescens TaxID=28028 RepID=UPI003FD668BB